MAAIEFEVIEIPAQVKREATRIKTLSAGDNLKFEVGEDELDEVVPEGKQWQVVLNVRLVEIGV